MDRCHKDVSTAKKLVRKSSFPHSGEKMENFWGVAPPSPLAIGALKYKNSLSQIFTNLFAIKETSLNARFYDLVHDHMETRFQAESWT